MSDNRTLVPNVLAFIDRTAELCGRMMAEQFAHEMEANCLECGLQSPLEDMFWVACHALCESAYTEVNPGPPDDASRNPQAVWPSGLYVTPQARIGKYRVDFLLRQERIGPDEILTPVIVELDGHDFHDKDKRQRAYEKARDRFLTSQGYRVLHYTGSEVVADPFKVAHEVLSMLGVFSGTGRGDYDPKDPLCLE